MNTQTGSKNLILPKEGKVFLTPLVVVTFFTLTFFIYEDFAIRMLFGYMILAFFVVWYIAGHLDRISFHNGKKAAFFLAAILTFLLFMPNARMGQGVIYLVLAADMGMLMVILADPGEEELRTAMNLFKVGAVLVSLYLIAVEIFPAVYYQGTRNLIDERAVKTVDLLLKNGYGVAIGRSVVLGDYISFMGYAIALNSILSGARSKNARWKDLAVAGICFISIVLMNRKSELLATLLVTLFLFSQKISFSNAARRKKIRFLFLAVAALVVVGFLFLISRGYLTRYAAFGKKLFSNLLDDTGSSDISSGRLRFWKRAWELFTESPILGVGFGQFASYMTDTFNIYSDTQMTNVHNNYLQLLCETGIVGTTLVLLPMIVLFVRTYKKARRNRAQGKTATVQGVATLTSLSFQLFSFLLSAIDPIWYKMVYWSFYASVLILANGSENG